jgi:hypothetical protein
MMTFGPAGPAGVQLHVGVTRTEWGFELVGRIEPPAPAEVQISYRDGSVRRRADERGHFDADLPMVTSIRFEVRDAASPIVTGWVPIG